MCILNSAILFQKLLLGYALGLAISRGCSEILYIYFFHFLFPIYIIYIYILFFFAPIYSPSSLPFTNLMPDICPICNKIWRNGQQSIECTSCLGWIHHKNRNNCSGLTDFEFEHHFNNLSKPYKCDNCITNTNAKTLITLPFANLDEDNWLNFNEIKPGPNDPDPRLEFLKAKQFISKCNSFQYQINLDDDADNLHPQINSNYVDIQQFNSLKLDLPSSFGLFHVNIASLNYHIDDLKLILSRLNLNFDVIGVSEHKILKDTLPTNDIEITGYDKFIFEPTESNCGGTGFYIKDNLDYDQRIDLQINSTRDYESTFIEIKFPHKKNLIVGCIYRHPSSKISVKDFSNQHLEPILQKISSEKKQCILMGDFNIDLLKIDINNDSSIFYNDLTSHFFTPYILQPTRLQSKSLIDNIFFNSLEYHSHSGNLLYEISDHLIQFVILEGFVKERTIPEINLYKRDLRNFNDREFEELVINGLDWDRICDLERKDSDYSCKNFFDTLNFYLDEMAPYKKVTKKEFKLMTKPWITKEILDKCNKRVSILKSITTEQDDDKKSSLL